MDHLLSSHLSQQWDAVVAADGTTVAVSRSQPRGSDEAFRAVIAALEEGVLVFDEHGGVLLTNPSAERILGAPDAVLRSGARIETFSEDGVLLDAERQPARRCLATGQPQLGSVLGIRRSDGKLRWLSVNSVPVSDPITGARRAVTSFTDVTERRLAEEQLRRQAVSDPLTGIPNRLLFTDRLQQALHRLERRGSGVAVLLLDLDRFKVINDSLGHQVGDDVLVATARRLMAVARPSDTVARLGGDEFAVVAEGMTSPVELAAFAGRILDSLRRPVRAGTEEVVATASIGVTSTASPDMHPAELLRQADLALYRAKELGRDCYAAFDERLQDRAVQRLAVEQLVRRAVGEDRLVIEFQPVVDLRTEGIVAAEALVRIDDPDEGLLHPERFLRAAEESGLITDIDQWMLAAATMHVARWRHPSTLCPVPVALNVTANDLADPTYVKRVASSLRRFGLDGSSLQVEITERVLLETSSALTVLEDLRALGVRVGLDDFGTGFSALSYLQTVPLDFVKIDRTFIDAMATSERSTAIVAAVIDLAHALGLAVTAEGVETADQLQALRRLGCDRAQGNLFAPSQPASVFAKLLSAGHRR